MPGHTSTPANLVSYFSLIMLFLSTGGHTAAQSALESAAKGRVQATPSEPADTIPLVNPASDRTKVESADPVKSEVDLMNAKANTKGQPGATPAPQPPVVCQRTVNAD